MEIRPEAREKLRQGFQRKADEQRRRYAGQLARAEELAASLAYGEVVGIFARQVAGDRGLRRRDRSRLVWLYAFTGGYLVLGGLPSETDPVRWSQVTRVREVWTMMSFADFEPRPVLTAHELDLAAGSTRVISQSYRNMLDPAPAVGRPLRDAAPAAVAATWPEFPLISEVIAAYAGRPSG
jgi:hypothetical protein